MTCVFMLEIANKVGDKEGFPEFGFHLFFFFLAPDTARELFSSLGGERGRVGWAGVGWVG